MYVYIYIYRERDIHIESYTACIMYISHIVRCNIYIYIYTYIRHHKTDISDVFIFVTLGITWHCTCLHSVSFAFSCGRFQLLSFHVFAENVLIGMVLSSGLPEPQCSTASSGCPPTGKPRGYQAMADRWSCRSLQLPKGSSEVQLPRHSLEPSEV